MVKVANIKIDILNIKKEFDNDKNKDMKLCKKYLKYLEDDVDNKADIKELLPSSIKHKVSFELLETHPEVSNGIRRCLTSELSIISMTINKFSDIECTDKYILADFIKKQLESIPIIQEYYKEYSKVKLSLFVQNKTDKNINITSGDLNCSSGHDIKKIISSNNIVLSKLRPDCFIKINNINLVMGKGLIESNKFTVVSNINYKILDVKPLLETKDTTEGKTSLIVNPTKFRLSYTTYGNFKEPKHIMKLCCDNFINRFKIILDELMNVDYSEDQYFSDLIEIETKKNIKIIYIKNEYWTMSNLLSKYCFLETKGNIKFICPGIVHPEINTGFIKISHPQYLKVVQNSLKKLIDDFKKIKSSF